MRRGIVGDAFANLPTAVVFGTANRLIASVADLVTLLDFGRCLTGHVTDGAQGTTGIFGVRRTATLPTHATIGRFGRTSENREGQQREEGEAPHGGSPALVRPARNV